MVNDQPISALGEAGHDDRLFINLARNIINSEWLGDYDQLTLAKGSFYPMWIAAIFFTSIPLLLSQQLLYIFACLVAAIAIKPLFNRRHYFLFITIYAALLFNPMSYGNEIATRVIREGIYMSLVLLIASISVGLLIRAERQKNFYYLWLLGLGLSLSAFWLTREEGLWIVPFLFPVFFVLIYTYSKHNANKIIRGVILNLSPIIILIVSLLFVSAINFKKYGIFNTVEFKNHDFLRAFGSLTRVKQNNWRPYILAPKETRLRIYKISPSFAKLEPFLEGNLGNDWAKCANSNLPIDSSEIVGGWFMWAFRDAVAEAGYYTNGRSALGFYKQMADEIDQACDKKQIECFRNNKSIAPPWKNDYLLPLYEGFIEDIRQLVRFDGFNAIPDPSEGTPNSLFLFSQITGEPINNVREKDEDSQMITSGWAFSTNDKITLSVIDNENNPVEYTVKYLSSQDVFDSFLALNGQSFPNAQKARFAITYSCQNECFILIQSQAGMSEKIAIGEKKSLQSGDIFAHIDEVKKQNDLTDKIGLRDIWIEKKIRILNCIGFLYRFSSPYLSIIATIFFILATLNIRKLKNYGTEQILYVISLSSLLAITARILILALINATSFPTTMFAYFATASPLLLIYIICNIILFLRFFTKKAEGDHLPETSN